MRVLAERWPNARVVAPRFVNVVLGTGLFLSAFAWPHAGGQMTNTLVVGTLCVAFALVAMAVPWVHHLDTLLAIWLFVSTWTLPALDSRTVWTNVLVAIAVFVASLFPWDASVTEPEGRPSGSRTASAARSGGARRSLGKPG